MTKPIFYEGQAVGCLMFGETIVTKVTETHLYTGAKDTKRLYFKNGAYWSLARPTLYPIEQYRAIIATLPAPQPEAWQPKPGQWCWFWDDTSNFMLVSKFAAIRDGDYKYMASTGSAYKNCAPFKGELPEHLKEVSND